MGSSTRPPPLEGVAAEQKLPGARPGTDGLPGARPGTDVLPGARPGTDGLPGARPGTGERRSTKNAGDSQLDGWPLAFAVGLLGAWLTAEGGSLATDDSAIRALGLGGGSLAFSLETLLGPLLLALPFGTVSNRLAWGAVLGLALFAREISLHAAALIAGNRTTFTRSEGRANAVFSALAGAFAALATPLLSVTIHGGFPVYSLLLFAAILSAQGRKDLDYALPLQGILLVHDPILGALTVAALGSQFSPTELRRVAGTTWLRGAALFAGPLVAAAIVTHGSLHGAEGGDLFAALFGAKRQADSARPPLFVFGLLPAILALVGTFAALREGTTRKGALTALALTTFAIGAPRFAPIGATSAIYLLPIAILAPYTGFGIATLARAAKGSGVAWMEAVRVSSTLFLLAVLVRDVDRISEQDPAASRLALATLLASHVPTGTLVLEDDPAIDRFLAASRLRGEPGHDLVVLPLRALGSDRAKAWARVQDAPKGTTDGHLRQQVMGNLVLEGAIASRTESELAASRPVATIHGLFLDPKALRGIVPGSPLALIAPEPRGPSDRLMAARAFVPVREAAARALQQGHDGEATALAIRLLRGRLILLAALGDRDPLSAAIDDLRRLAPEDRLAAEATKRVLLNRIPSLSEFAPLVQPAAPQAP